MKVYQTTITSFSDYSPEIQKLKQINPQLIFVFGNQNWFIDSAPLISFLKEHFPNAIRVGCSTAGEILAKNVQLNTLTLNAVCFDKARVEISTQQINGSEDSREAGKRAALSMSPNLKALMVFSPGTQVNGSDLVLGLKSVIPESIPITGGLAGDYGNFQKTYTLCNETISDNQLVCLGFYGEKLGYYHGSAGGWQVFGPARKITRASGNVLYELDGERALDFYKKYLGEYSKDLPSSGLLFPFSVLNEKNQETGVVRTILGVDESTGSLTFAGDITNGSSLKLLHAGTDQVVDGAEQAARQALVSSQTSTPNSLLLLVSCIGRRLVMGDRVDEEIEAVSRVFSDKPQITGFYSYGEICPNQNGTETQLHNQTMTITYIVEL